MMVFWFARWPNVFSLSDSKYGVNGIHHEKGFQLISVIFMLIENGFYDTFKIEWSAFRKSKKLALPIFYDFRMW